MTLATIARGFHGKLSIEGHTRADRKMIRILDELNKPDVRRGKFRIGKGTVNLIFISILLLVSILVLIASVVR